MTDGPLGSTHMRRPEYVTAWLYDVTQRWPTWLVDKYTNTAPVPEKMIGCYATAINGEFWRWFEPEKFNELFVSIPALAQALEVTPAMLDAGAQALANDVWHPPQPLASLSNSDVMKYRRQALLVLKASLSLPSASRGTEA